MNKIIEIPFILPFYTQRVTEESWKADGFLDLQEGLSWQMRGCGIASLRMVIDGFLQRDGMPCCEKQGEMIRKGLLKEAYKPGVGWIHRGLAEMAGEYGLLGVPQREKVAADVTADILSGKPCILSVSPRFAGGKPDGFGNIYGKGGHLVVAYGYEADEEEKATAFLVHHPSCFLEYNWAAHRVNLEEFQASFSGNYIAFQKNGTQ